MAYVDEATIKAIRKNHPIKDIVERYGVRLTKKGENDYWGNCPFHMEVLGKEDLNASMSVAPNLDIFQCFSCKTAGNIFNFISRKESISYGEAIHLLAKEDGFEVGNAVKRENPYEKDYQVMELALKIYKHNINSDLGENAIRYLQERAITRDIIQNFEIGLSTSRQPLTPILTNKYELNHLIDLGLSNLDGKDVFNERIMIPIHDLNGNPIGFGGRIYQTKDNSKYINTKATRIFDKGKILYNYHRAHKKLTKDDAIIIMEGYFDVIRAATVGIENCVAPMGTSLTKQQVQILKKITNRIILCFDGDKPGELATDKAIPLLIELGMDVKIVRLEEKDPDEFIIKRGREAFLDKLKNPLSVIEYRMQTLREGKNLNDDIETVSYVNEVLQELAKEQDILLVDLMLNKISNQYGFEYENLKSKYKQYKKDVKIEIIPDKPIVKNVSKIPKKYGQATDNLLYYMTISPEVIELSEANVTMIMNDKKRRLFNEIIYYYKKYGEIIIADFITYLTVKTDVSDTFQEILNLNLKKMYSKEEIADYIKCVNEYHKNSIIDKLKLDLTKETDPLKQANILKEIMKIRGVKTSD